MFKIIIGILIATAVVIVGFMVLDPSIDTVKTNETVEVSNASNNGLTYSIEGEVNKPGTYSLDENITMKDLIEASGGLTSNGDELAFFEDAKLQAGTTYYIASKYDASDICNNNEIKKVNINTDDADTLTTINGITTSIASSIVSYRVSNGTFQTLEQLTEVYGIGNATYHKIRNYVILHS